MTVPPNNPPGWYPDPSNPQKKIYWDGSAWNGPPAPALADKSGPGKQKAVGIGVAILTVIGLFMTMQSVSLMSGSGPLWTGVGFVAAGTAVAFFMGASKTMRVIAAICLAIALINVFYMENQLNQKRNELSEIFDN